jgi:hypothetical protein
MFERSVKSGQMVMVLSRDGMYRVPFDYSLE